MTVQRRPRPKPEPAAKQKLRLWLRLLRTSRAIEVELRERLRVAFGMTLPKFDVMAALDRKPAGMTMTELSRFLMVSNGNVTGIIDRLVSEGMVVRLRARGGPARHLRPPHAQGRAAVPGHGQSARGLGQRDPGRLRQSSDSSRP